MTFSETIYAATGAFGWVIIALAVVALLSVVAGYWRQARTIARERGWPALWQHIRVHVLTRKPRNRP